MKTLLIIVDGMRPDALERIEEAQKLLWVSSYTPNATTVFPSVTLPCHVSLFHSVDPSRHGTTTNTYMPQVRPINGLCEVLQKAKKTCAFFYNWEQLRDLSRPNSLEYSYFCKGDSIGYDKANEIVTDAAIKYLTENETDFCFLYLGYTDWAGHKHGWMSDQYMDAMANSWSNISRVLKALPDDYAVIITADHGGHDRTHGSTLPVDMTIPLLVYSKGQVLELDVSEASIKDVAPTIVQLLGVEPDEEWEGKSLLK
jgi:predicted AlkP superfamily pyrophosphatase or phosphodiesterase